MHALGVHLRFSQVREAVSMMRLATALVLAALAAPAGANTLYKSIDANGTVTFSDLPPPPGSQLLEQRSLE